MNHTSFFTFWHFDKLTYQARLSCWAKSASAVQHTRLSSKFLTPSFGGLRVPTQGGSSIPFVSQFQHCIRHFVWLSSAIWAWERTTLFLEKLVGEHQTYWAYWESIEPLIAEDSGWWDNQILWSLCCSRETISGTAWAYICGTSGLQVELRGWPFGSRLSWEFGESSRAEIHQYLASFWIFRT